MKALRPLIIPLALIAIAVVTAPAQASFHLMQVEQLIGGVNSDASAQAIQLRMRLGGQSLVAQGRVKAWDAAGLNPVLLIDLTTNVTNGLQGDRVLIVSSAFQTHVSPIQIPDFTMVNLIPASYFTAGSLTFEDDFGTIYWRLSWGGASYTGSGTVSTFNDANGNANPAFNGPLPSTGLQALRFTGAASALSTTNAAYYALTAGASTWTNNARLSETVQVPTSVGNPPAGSGVQLGRPVPNPTTGSIAYTVSLERGARVRVEVYGTGGRLMRTLLDRDLTAGHHAFAWDGRSDADAPLASGVYYLRLTAAGVRLSRTVSIVR